MSELTDSQVACLRSVLYHGVTHRDCRGAAQHGARVHVARKLAKLGLIALGEPHRGWVLTAAGREALAAVKGR